ncbi:immunity 49 family protein [Kitasatospora sp. NPDC053057]|uniref:immunity 49 family protein n=1 Tax=Kitasatospora sp. NPDC053057 TaxID=3364062 RepID=UPI0037C72CC5
MSTEIADFATRIGREVHSYSRAGLMTGTEWTVISRAFLDHLNTLSTSAPGLNSPEAKAVLKDAAESAIGAVSFAAYYPREHFQVFLDYVDFGMEYDPEPGSSAPPIRAFRWIDAFCLAILTDSVSRHGEAFVFTWQALTPPNDLATGLLSHFVDAVDLPSDVDSHPGLQALHALATNDRPTFDTAVAALLHVTQSPLPLLPLALSALAYRTHRWLPSPDTDRLPHALVTNFEAPARGPVTWPARLDRPAPPRPLPPTTEVRFEQAIQDALSPSIAPSDAVAHLDYAFSKQTALIRSRASLSPDVTDVQLAGLRRASQIGAALFRLALAEPGTSVDVVIDGRTLTLPATRDDSTHPGRWHLALNYALITGVREDLAPLVLAGPAVSQDDRTAYAAYRVALHDHLRAVDPAPAIEKALREAALAERQGFPPMPVALLAQLVDGDETGFNLALLDFLEAHRDHYSVADRPTDPEAAISLDALALACHARRRGRAIRVESPYLPVRLLLDSDHGR